MGFFQKNDFLKIDVYYVKFIALFDWHIYSKQRPLDISKNYVTPTTIFLVTISIKFRNSEKVQG